MTRWRRPTLVIAAVSGSVMAWRYLGSRRAETTTTARNIETEHLQPVKTVALAVLGNSDSHSYHDRFLLGSGTARQRGGDFHSITYQWTEVLSRLRPVELDQGPWGVWGDGKWERRLKRLIGRDARGPRKEDFRYNFAISGAHCSGPGVGWMKRGLAGQAPALRDEMDSAPRMWSEGIVVVRIGINDLGTAAALDRFARFGLDAAARAEVRRCTTAVREAVVLIRKRHPTTRFVLVGVPDNADDPRFRDKWQNREMLVSIARVVDAYNLGLCDMANGDSRIVFFDDQAWFSANWGGRDAAGQPAYSAVSLGGSQPVSMTIGDRPVNAALADGHAGTAYNGLWARALVRLLNKSFDLSIPDIQLDEISRLADPDGHYGLRAK